VGGEDERQHGQEQQGNLHSGAGGNLNLNTTKTQCILNTLVSCFVIALKKYLALLKRLFLFINNIYIAIILFRLFSTDKTI